MIAEIRGLCKKVGVDEVIRPGPEADYPNSMIITLLILKSLFGFDSESSFLRFVKMHYQDRFPDVPERSWFNRKAKKLMLEQNKIHRLLLEKLDVKHLTLEIVDSTPVPVVKRHRARTCKSFRRGSEVNYGYCASKDEYYYGKKLSLFVTEQGIPTGYGLTPANRHDLVALKEMLPCYGVNLYKKQLIADKGYYDGDLRVELKNRFHARLVVPDKKRHHQWNTKRDKRLLKKRAIVETVNEQLQDHMKINHTRARSNHGLLSRVRSIILAFVFGCYFNILHKRPPLTLKSLLI